MAGAFVDDAPGDPFDLGAHVAAAEAIASQGGTPVVFPSHGRRPGRPVHRLTRSGDQPAG